RNAESHCDRQLRSGARTPQERWQIVRKRILRTRYARAGNKIKKTAGSACNLRQPFVGRSRCTKKNRVKMARMEDFLILNGFFRNQIGRENPICTRFRSGCCEFLEAHLQNGIVVTEKDDGYFRSGEIRIADFSNQLDHSGERRTSLKCPL